MAELDLTDLIEATAGHIWGRLRADDLAEGHDRPEWHDASCMHREAYVAAAREYLEFAAPLIAARAAEQARAEQTALAKDLRELIDHYERQRRFFITTNDVREAIARSHAAGEGAAR